MKIFDQFKRQVKSISRIGNRLTTIGKRLSGVDSIGPALQAIHNSVRILEMTMHRHQKSVSSHYDIVDRKTVLYDRAISDTAERASDIWGLRYAHSSNGYYPSGNELGRRALAPEDLGLENWSMYRKCGVNTVLDYVINEDVFILLKGFTFNPMKGGMNLKGIKYEMSGIQLPYVPFGPDWIQLSDGSVDYEFDQSVVISPKNQMVIKAHFGEFGKEEEPACQLMVRGEVIGKRSYIIKDPTQLKKEWPKKPDAHTDK